MAFGDLLQRIRKFREQEESRAPFAQRSSLPVARNYGVEGPPKIYAQSEKMPDKSVTVMEPKDYAGFFGPIQRAMDQGSPNGFQGDWLDKAGAFSAEVLHNAAHPFSSDMRKAEGQLLKGATYITPWGMPSGMEKIKDSLGIKSDQRLEDITSKIKRGGDIALGDLFSTFTGGLFSPETVPYQDRTFTEKVAGAIGGGAGMIIGLKGIGKITGSIGEGLREYGTIGGAMSRLAKYPKLYSVASNMVDFASYSQLSPDLGMDLKRRVETAAKSAALAPVFELTGAAGWKAGVPINYALGHVLTKLDGGKDEDAIVNGLGFMALGIGAHVLNGQMADKIVSDKARETLKQDGTSGPDIDGAKRIARDILGKEAPKEVITPASLEELKMKTAEAVMGPKIEGTNQPTGDPIKARLIEKLDVSNMTEQEFKNKVIDLTLESNDVAKSGIDNLFMQLKAPEIPEGQTQKTPRFSVGETEGGAKYEISDKGVVKTGGRQYNIDKFGLEEGQKQAMAQNIADIANHPKFREQVGKTVTEQEINDLAVNLQARMELDPNIPREQHIIEILKAKEGEAAILKAQEEMGKYKEGTPEYEKASAEHSREVVKWMVEGTGAGRRLQARQQEASKIFGEDTTPKTKMVQRLYSEVGKENTAVMEKIVEESGKVDWNNPKEAAKFYRQFVKPKWNEILDEYRYSNMLSSPRSQLRNLLWNVEQTFVKRPIEILSKMDPVGTGKYIKGVFGSFGKAKDAFISSWKSGTMGEKTLDVSEERIRTGWVPEWFKSGPRAMEASDKFFTTLISEGEIARGVRPEIAGETATRMLGRSEYDWKNKSGQGWVSSSIDASGKILENAGKIMKPIRWPLAFLRTSTQIAKIFVENSPAGYLNLLQKSSPQTAEIFLKATLGTVVSSIGMEMALNGKTTWLPPKDEKGKEAFYNAGLQPLSVEIKPGVWVPMQYFGPYAFALAIPAAYKYYNYDAPDASKKTLDWGNEGNMALGLLRTFVDLTPIAAANDFLQALSGTSQSSIGKAISQTGTQVIPWSGFEQYITQVIDPVRRKATGVKESFQRALMFQSKYLEPYMGAGDKPTERNWSDYVAPYTMGFTNEKWLKWYEDSLKAAQKSAANKNIGTEGKDEKRKLELQQRGFMK